jgi:type II secretion system protein G
MEIPMLTRLALAVAALLIVSGCAEDNSEAAKKAVRSHLPVAYEVEYSELVNYPGGVVCGEFDPIGRFGVHEGKLPFIFRAGEADVVPSADDLAIFCSSNPKAAFESHFNLGYPQGENDVLAKVIDDFRTLAEALEAYRADNMIYPITEQGLDALVTASERYPMPPKFREGGYIRKVPQDPWGRPYVYQSEEVLRLEPIVYSLHTMGKDGAEGGEGENADIGVDKLKYLDHIGSL